MAHWFIFYILAISFEQIASTLTANSLNQALSLAKLLQRRQFELQTNDPNASTECFNLYLPQLQSAADQWSSSYADCYNNADNRRYNFIEQLKSDQTNINDSSNDVCNYIRNCQGINNTLDYFQCFANLSQNVVTTIYLISNNASDDAILLTQQLDGINSDLYICTNDTQRAYVEQTAVIFDALDDCLIYGLDVNSSTTENVNKLEILTMESDVEGTEINGSGDNIDATLTTQDDNTTINDETTLFEHTTIPIMSV